MSENNETETERRQREEYERAQLEKQALGDNKAVTIEQRQNEEWQRAQRQKEPQDKPYEFEETQTTGKSINAKVVSQFWLDGLLCIISLFVLFVFVIATIKTEFWSYSPLKAERADKVIVCWPIHTFYENDDYHGYDGRFSYLNKDSLPPEIAKDYDPINKKIMEVIHDEQNELHVKIKWGAYPVINAQEKLEVMFMASDKEQVCNSAYREAQTISLK